MAIEIYTDGSSDTKTRVGGWGYAIVIDGELFRYGSGHLDDASNNDAELMAAINGLESLVGINFNTPLNGPKILKSDSRLILGWADGNYRFKQANKIHLHEKLLSLVQHFNCKTEWVKGHSGNKWNTFCDKLANDARLNLAKTIETKEKEEKGETLIAKRKTGVVCLYYKNKLKIIDLANNIVEDYSRELHGSRGGILEIREEKIR